MKYVLRRIGHSLLLLFGVSVLCFLFSDLAPGTFFDEMRLNPQISPETVAALKADAALDRPLPVRYGHWLRSAISGEFGYSFAYNSPVTPLLAIRIRNTLILTSLSTLLVWLIALPLGMWAAAQPRGWASRLTLPFSSFLHAIPELVLVLGLLALAVRSGALPVGGMVSEGFEEMSFLGKTVDFIRHLAIPLTVLTAGALPLVFRHIRSSFVDVLDAPYLRAAAGYGIGPIRLLVRHALPAAANPLISLFGLSIGGLLSGSLLVEVATGWPGIGPLLLNATMDRDLYVVIGAVMASTILMIAGNLLADFLLIAVDPRIRTE
jgi:peptide/nickel transport system permease protein